LRKLFVFLVTYCKIFHPKYPFHEKIKMTKKKRQQSLRPLSLLAPLIVIAPIQCFEVTLLKTQNNFHIDPSPI
jgi:hypothetical protein